MSGHDYPTRPLVGVATVVFRGDTVLLIRRARPPLAGAWSFPGGGQELGETVEETARREIREETGLLVAAPLRLVAHVDAIHRDAGGRIVFHYTILDLAGDDDGTADPVAGCDAAEARFVPLDALEALGLDAAHREVVEKARGLPWNGLPTRGRDGA